ncbi:unnamed protein product [Brassica oleracea]
MAKTGFTKTDEPPSQPKGGQEDKISKAYEQAASRQSITHGTAQIYRTSCQKTISNLCLLIFPAENWANKEEAERKRKERASPDRGDERQPPEKQTMARRTNAAAQVLGENSKK